MAAAVAEDVGSGMENALSIARSLYQQVEKASKHKHLRQDDAQALHDIKKHIGDLEAKVREAKVALDEASKNELIHEVEPLRLQVIETCRQHQHVVQNPAAKDLIQMALDWCEIKDSGINSAPAPSTPAYRLPSQHGVLQSTDDDTCSGWSRASMLSMGTKDMPGILEQQAATGTVAPHLSLADNRQQSLRAIKTHGSVIGSSPTRASYQPSLIKAARTPQELHHQALLFADTFGMPVGSDQSGWPAATATSAGGAGSVHDSLALTRIHAGRLGAYGSGDAAAASAAAGDGMAIEQQLKQSPGVRQQLRFMHLDPNRVDGSYGSPLASRVLPEQPVAPAGRYRLSGGDDDSGNADGGQQLRCNVPLRNSPDSLQKAALYASQVSKVHVFKDAVPVKACGVRDLVDVHQVPECLAVVKRRPWWSRLVRMLVGTALLTGGLVAVGVTAAGMGGAGSTSMGGDGTAAAAVGQHSQARNRKTPNTPSRGLQLPFAPVGPAPDASAGCG